VWGINTASWNNKRPCGVTDPLQVRKHLVEFHSDDSRNILANDPSGSDGFNNPQHFRPEVTVIIFAFLLPGDTERLTRESSANKVNWFKVVSTFSDVSVFGDIGPMFREDFSTIFVNFHLPFACHPSPFKSEIKTTDACEKGTEIQVISPP